ncbi:MAG TPA: FUSC family protein [Acidimicrobiia bacterium]|nr:FUSC family protein [Acidimicrobiia bacterium]
MPPARQPGIVWAWPAALAGAAFAIPAALAMPVSVDKGLALGFGVLPAAIVGIAPRRRDRVRIVLMGVLMGVPLAVGASLASWPVLAVASVFVLAVGAAQLSTKRPVGRIALSLSVPLVGVGLSYNAGKGAGVALLIVAGSVFAMTVAMLWPQHDAPEHVRVVVPAESMLGYGVRLGLAGGTAAAIGFWFEWEHVGWAAAAAMLVMRPSIEMQELRSWGRVASVIIGGLAAAGLAHATTAPGWYSLAIIVVIAGAGATYASRWYVTPTFTTFIAISLLVYANTDTAQSRFNERVGETLLGVALAYFFGLLVPRVFGRGRPRATLPR